MVMEALLGSPLHVVSFSNGKLNDSRLDSNDMLLFVFFGVSICCCTGDWELLYMYHNRVMYILEDT